MDDTVRQFDSAEDRSRIAAAEIIIAHDPDQESRAILYGRELLEDVATSTGERNVRLLTFNLDSALPELDALDARIREIKGSSSFRPADLFPDVRIDAPSFKSDQDLLEPVRAAVAKICADHRQLLPRVQLRFYYSVKTAGFTTANEELRQGAQAAEMPVAYITSLVTLGHVLYTLLPSELIKPTRCIDIVHSVGPRGNELGIRCRSLLMRKTPKGQAYYSRRLPKMRFGRDRQERIVAFSEHALERICERTVYDWRTFGGHGDAFAFLDNCVYFEDCTDLRGEPSFAVYNSCAPHFHSWNYVRNVLGGDYAVSGDVHRDIVKAAADYRLFYRVGYCPVTLHGDLALATTLLVPGMSRQKGTPEGNLILNSGLTAGEITRMKNHLESQLSMKALADSDDFSLIKWFHENGVPQVISIDAPVFKFD